jgi:hypothetical protein
MISLLGRVVGEYRLVSTMGSGALGETFRAESVRGDGRTAAVKIMHAHLASDPASTTPISCGSRTSASRAVSST